MATEHVVHVSSGEKHDVELTDEEFAERFPDVSAGRRDARLRLVAAMDRLREHALTDPVVADLLVVLSSGQEGA